MPAQFIKAGLLSPAFAISRRIHKSLLAIVCFSAGVSWCANVHPQAFKLPVTKLQINNKEITAEIASTEQSRNYGLMFRNKLDKDNGMLFVFEKPAMPCFWMKNTPLPLTIAFIDKTGLITDLHDMPPYTKQSFCPSVPILYALEMNQGWFANNNISIGAKVDGLNKKSPVSK